jgi:hypothetical protein
LARSSDELAKLLSPSTNRCIGAKGAAPYWPTRATSFLSYPLCPPVRKWYLPRLYKHLFTLCSLIIISPFSNPRRLLLGYTHQGLGRVRLLFWKLRPLFAAPAAPYFHLRRGFLLSCARGARLLSNERGAAVQCMVPLDGPGEHTRKPRGCGRGSTRIVWLGYDQGSRGSIRSGSAHGPDVHKSG